MADKHCSLLGTDEQKNRLDNLVNNSIKRKYTIIKLLQGIQEIYGYLPENVIKVVAEKTDKPLNEFYSVATFYAEFSFSPRGKFPVSVCMGTACYVNGAEDIFNKVCQILGIKEGECTSDGVFSIDQTRCIGCCGMAPVMTIGNDVYGNVKLAEVEKILNKYMEKK